MTPEAIEALFVEAVAWPSGVADFLRRAGERTRAAFAATFADGRRLHAVACMEIYANAYFYRIKDALAEQFPLVHHVLGPDGFHNLATDYLCLAPPRSPDLARAGDRLPAFLRAFAACRRDPPYLADFARCEWAEYEALVAPAPPAPPPPPRDPTEALRRRFRRHPAARLFRSCWNYAGAVRARARAAPLPDAPTPGWNLIVRPAYAVVSYRLAPDEGALLSYAARGVTFVELCAEAARLRWSHDRLARTLAGWLETGALVAETAA